jgi:ribonuclease-3
MTEMTGGGIHSLPDEFPPDLGELQRTIGHEFANPALLRLALTHPSISHETGGGVESNQRLEFLGDAVLGLVLTRELYDRFPGEEEGPLTKARARLVNAKALAEASRKLGLGRFLRVSHGEEQSGGRSRVSALADAFEAVIGAIYLDGGLEAAARFVLGSLVESLSDWSDVASLDNPKGELQELLQARSNEAPVYELISVSGPDHDREFETLVRHAQVELGRGKGKSKKAAESEAALEALRNLRNCGGDATRSIPS